MVARWRTWGKSGETSEARSAAWGRSQETTPPLLSTAVSVSASWPSSARAATPPSRRTCPSSPSSTPSSSMRTPPRSHAAGTLATAVWLCYPPRHPCHPPRPPWGPYHWQLAPSGRM